MTTTTIQGINFRVLDSFAHTPYKRATAFQLAVKDADLGMRREDILAGIALAKEEFNRGKYAESIGYITAIESNLQTYTSLKSLLAVGNTFILLDDEELGQTNPKFTAEKMRLIQSSDEIRFFFLATTINLLKAMSILANTTKIEDYLTGELAQVEALSLSLIGRDIYNL